MRKAYDTFLLSEVSSVCAAKDGSFERYRYECAHCGEEVLLAAVNSTRMVPHFRHRSGNNDVECEDYLRQAVSTDSHSRKSKNERAEFYFDSNTKMFYLGLRFSDKEIADHEQSAVTFELRTATNAEAFYSSRIDKMTFYPDIPNMIPLEIFSHNYFLSYTSDGVRREYEVFNKKDTPVFFKMQVGDNDYKAKLVRSSILYTNTRYFVAYPNKHWALADGHLQNEIKIEKIFEFETMGKKFEGRVLIITSKTAQIDSFLSSLGYKLEVSETLTLLWPPAFFSDEVLLVNAEVVYLYSSFELQAHGNINVRSSDIAKVDDGISKVAVHSKIKVYKKNAELMLENRELEKNAFEVLSIERTASKTYTIPTGAFYLFNRSGVLPLTEGMNLQMTPGCEVKHYVNGYLDKIVTSSEQTTMTAKDLLQDVLMYYKRSEVFRWDDYDTFNLSRIALQYLKSCKKTGEINSVLKKYIMEGQI